MWKFNALIFVVNLLCVFGWRSSTTCPRPWRRVHNGCYLFHTKVATWDNARQTCADAGGILISISSKRERMFIMRKMHMLTRTSMHTNWWMGLSLNKSIAKWKWEDGTDLHVKVVPWTPGEPNNSLRDEQCAEMNIQGKLNDQNCDTFHPFICERHTVIAPRPTTRTTRSTTPKKLPTKSTSIPTTQPPQTVTQFPKELIKTTKFFNPDVNFTVKQIYITEAIVPTSQRHKHNASVVLATTESIITKHKPEPSNQNTHSGNKRQSTVHFHNNLHKSTNNVHVDDESTISSMDPVRIPTRNEVSITTRTREVNIIVTECQKIMAYDISWPRAQKGEIVSRPCKTGTGFAVWTCDGEPAQWVGEPNVFDCISKDIRELAKLTPTTQNGVTELTSSMISLLSNKDRTAADLLASAEIIRKLSIQKVKDYREFTSIAQDVVAIGSLLVKQTQTSGLLSTGDKGRVASTILSLIESSAGALIQSINRPSLFQTKSHQLSMTFHVVNSTSTPRLVYTNGESDNAFTIPQQVLKRYNKGDLTKVIFMTHSDATNLLPMSNSRYTVLKDIVSASIPNYQVKDLTEPITFTMGFDDSKSKKRSSIVKPLCSFWDFSKGSVGDWSQSGCEMMEHNGTHVTCQCNHLTNFAVLLDVSGVELQHEHLVSLTFISYIGCVVSIIFLATSWLTFQCLGTLQCERNSIHKNLVFCLFVAEIIFVVGIERTEQKVACAAVALLLHFFFLSAFTWMLMEGVHIVIMLVQVFDAAKSRLKYYYLVGYGAPIIVVGATATTDFTAYGTVNYCWLTVDKWFIWSFAGPVALVLLVNAIVLSYSLTMVCRHSAFVFAQDRSQSGTFKSWIQGAFAIEVLLGLTWVFGYFFINKETVSLAYIFTIMNSLQGLFIFIFHCAMNRKVRGEYKKIVRLSKKVPPTTKQSSVQKQSGSYELYVPST